MTDDRGRQQRDEGFSLIELLAAVSLMGIAMVAILSALGVMITSSREHRQMANAQVLLASAAEKVKGAAYVPCTDVSVGATYAGVAGTASRPSDWGTGGDVAVTAVEYWNGTAFELLSAVPCALDSGIERITLRVTSPDGGTTDTVSILKAGLASSTGTGTSACVVRKPGVEVKNNGELKETVSVRPDTPEWFKLHVDPIPGCPTSAQPLLLAIPGLPTAVLDLVPNPSSTDPTWEVKNLKMPPATTSGWETPGTILTAIVYDANGDEAGRFFLVVT